MKKINLIIGLLAILVSASCTRSSLTEISLNCGCIATEHFISSTNNSENRTKKYTFKNSQFFDLGVSIDGFANSFAFQICNIMDESDKFDIIEIDIVKEEKTNTLRTTTYSYEVKKVKAELTKYLKLESFVAKYVEYIYKKDYLSCLEYIDVDDKESFKTIIDNIYVNLYKDYKETRIVDYKSDGDSYSIYGIIKLESGKFDLFTMKLKEVENGYKLISFNF